MDRHLAPLLVDQVAAARAPTTTITALIERKAGDYIVHTDRDADVRVGDVLNVTAGGYTGAALLAVSLATFELSLTVNCLAGAAAVTFASSSLSVGGTAAVAGEKFVRAVPQSLVASGVTQLLFIPAVAGQRPPLNATCTWGGVRYAVRDVQDLPPELGATPLLVTVAR